MALVLVLPVPAGMATARAAWALHSEPAGFTAGQVAGTNPAARQSPVTMDPVILAGAGDICLDGRIARARQTAALIAQLPTAAVFTLGDNVQGVGAPSEFAGCFDRTWGAFKARIRPAPGNHDLMTAAGQAYYEYFGAAAGPWGLGYYSYDLPNDWHVVVLNSQCADVGGCERGSPQEAWLRRDLAVHAGDHFVAMWHIPEFSSGSGRRGTLAYEAFWDDLYDAHAEIVLNGHYHNYERFARQSPLGKADPRGIREFVAGTGGMDLGAWTHQAANSQIRISDGYGVLELILGRDGYDWQFLRVGDASPADSGHEDCLANRG